MSGRKESNKAKRKAKYEIIKKIIIVALVLITINPPDFSEGTTEIIVNLMVKGFMSFVIGVLWESTSYRKKKKG